METKAEFSTGRIYHCLRTWGEYQYFPFSTGYNMRLILHQEKNDPNNERTIGFRVEDDKYNGWTLSLSQNASKWLDFRPVKNNRELAPVFTVKEEKIECKVPITVPDVSNTDSENTIVNKKYLDIVINNAINNAVTNVYNHIQTAILSGLSKTFLRAKDTPLWDLGETNGQFVTRINSVLTSIACHHKTGSWCVASSSGLFGISTDDGESFNNFGFDKEELDHTSDFFTIIDTDIGWLVFSNKNTKYWYTDNLDFSSTGEYKTAPFIVQSGCYKDGKVYIYSANKEAISTDNGATFSVINTIDYYNTSSFTYCCPHPFSPEVVFFQNGPATDTYRYFYCRRNEDNNSDGDYVLKRFLVSRNSTYPSCEGICCSGNGIYYINPSDNGGIDTIKFFNTLQINSTNTQFYTKDCIVPIIYSEKVLIVSDGVIYKNTFGVDQNIIYRNPTDSYPRKGGYGRTYNYNILTGRTIVLTSSTKYLIV